MRLSRSGVASLPLVAQRTPMVAAEQLLPARRLWRVPRCGLGAALEAAPPCVAKGAGAGAGAIPFLAATSAAAGTREGMKRLTDVFVRRVALRYAP